MIRTALSIATAAVIAAVSCGATYAAHMAVILGGYDERSLGMFAVGTITGLVFATSVLMPTFLIARKYGLSWVVVFALGLIEWVVLAAAIYLAIGSLLVDAFFSATMVLPIGAGAVAGFVLTLLLLGMFRRVARQ